jgi:release factor glutamine methyltransferase
MDADIPGLRVEVREHEPAEALGAGPGGLYVIERIISDVAAYLVKGGLLAMEIGETMQPGIEELFDRYAGDTMTEPEFHPDLAGRTRIVTSYSK